MSSGVPLYYAGIAPDEDILDNLLVGNKRRLDHGNSSTLDVRRFLNVKYQQVPVGKMKRIVGGLVILVIFILLITLTVGSPSKANIQPAHTTTTQRLPPQNDPHEANTISPQAPTAHETVTKRPTTKRPEMQSDLNIKCHACALVGNSKMLLGSNAGSKIDSSECVFRVNNAPTLSFESDVGKKTTVRVFSAGGLRELSTKLRQTFPHRDELKFVVVLGTKNELCDNCTLIRILQRLAKHFKDVTFLPMTRDARQENSGPVRSTMHSCKVNTLALMTRVCQKIRVYGVTRNGLCIRESVHPSSYWSRGFVSPDCNDHVTNALRTTMERRRSENGMFEKLAQKYDIDFFYPSR